MPGGKDCTCVEETGIKRVKEHVGEGESPKKCSYTNTKNTYITRSRAREWNGRAQVL